MNEEDVTIPLIPGSPLRVSAPSESTTLTLPDSSGATSRVSWVPLGSDPSGASALGSLPTPEGRALLASGIILWARINALIIFGVTVFMGVTNYGARDAAMVPWPSLLLAVGLTATSVAVDRLRLDMRGLRIVDMVATVSSGVCFALLASMMSAMPTIGREFVFELTLAHALMIRAAVVPSSARRTLWIGILALVPGVIACIFGRVVSDLPWVLAAFQTSFRCAATIGASVLASRRIYGLERQVAKARRLGQYTLVEKVGTGGMGVVFKASHALLRRPTAIKLLRPEDAGESTLLQFEREAQITSQLTHPSTIQIYDFGRNESGVFYYAMEYLEGLTLHELVELTGPQSASRTIAILTQICGSLAEAHAAGLVHRDVKPANIMLCERGRVADVIKVLDFGLVKLRGQPANTLDGKSGTIAGTPGFMAPEAIIEPLSVDARSDIYSLGAVAYYLITGEHLFGDPGGIAVLIDQVNTAPIPLAVRLGQSVPDDLEQIVVSCLAKDPRRRPQSADELCQLLLACADAGGWPQAEAKAWWRTHRELVHQRVRDRSATINGSFAIGALMDKRH